MDVQSPTSILLPNLTLTASMLTWCF